jgi:folate-binding protein YgfZ
MSDKINYMTIGSRPHQTHSPLEQELCFSDQTNYYFELHQLGVIKVTGERAADFLQGQLTCDIRLINENTMQQGAQCNLQGRVLSLLDIIQHDGSYWLVLPADLVPQTMASLEKTAQLSRVKLEAISPIQAIGFYIHHEVTSSNNFIFPTTIKAVTHYDSYCCYRISNNTMILLDLSTKKSKLNQLSDQFTHQFTHKSELAWHYLQLKDHQIQIYPETRGLFLPHRLNLHHTDIISFNKGCYKGQEIIARTHYRATLKHELKISTIQINNLPNLGEPLIDPITHNNLGELVDYCPSNNTSTYLVATIQSI